jgi:hypothetical protein
MTDSRRDEVRKLVHEHLNAAMIMVPLDDPLDPEMTVADALDYLEKHEFDLALLRTPEVRIVYRDRLAQGSRLRSVTRRSRREHPVLAVID